MLLVSETPQSVCLCKYYENFLSLTKAIGKIIPYFPNTHNELRNTSKETHMISECNHCNEESVFSVLPLDTDLQKEMT